MLGGIGRLFLKSKAKGSELRPLPKQYVGLHAFEWLFERLKLDSRFGFIVRKGLELFSCDG